MGSSSRIEHLRALVRRLADADATVLLRGESGTGKELVAQALHQCGKRANQPLVTVNCAAIAPTLIESVSYTHLWRRQDRYRGGYRSANRQRRCS